MNETRSGTLARPVICVLGRRAVLGGVVAAAAAGIATRLGAPAAIAAQDATPGDDCSLLERRRRPDRDPRFHRRGD